MKQKMVIKVQLCCDKCRSQALKIAAVADGVSSVALEGDDKVVVIGEGVDAAELTCSLRKKFNCANLVTVEEVKPPAPPPPPPPPPPQPHCCPPPHCDLYKVVCDTNPPYICTIL